MSEIVGLLSSPAWWFSQVFVALLVGVFAGKLSVKSMRLNFEQPRNLNLVFMVLVVAVSYSFILYVTAWSFYFENPEGNPVWWLFFAVMISCATLAIFGFAIYDHPYLTVPLILVFFGYLIFSVRVEDSWPWQRQCMIGIAQISIWSAIFGGISKSIYSTLLGNYSNE